ncbi:hypothetical protein SBV1_370085 [Verrucomicrobia bacterium]|nr:hypothetical protein SBV1_370085 [Verrucomicrobiota bacterium]
MAGLCQTGRVLQLRGALSGPTSSCGCWRTSPPQNYDGELDALSGAYDNLVTRADRFEYQTIYGCRDVRGISVALRDCRIARRRGLTY